MKTKKILFSVAVILLACLAIVGGVAGNIKRKPIEAKQLSHAEVIEYETEEEDEKEIQEEGKKRAQKEEEKTQEETLISEDYDDTKVRLTSAEEDKIDNVTICVYGNSKVSLSPDTAIISARIETINGDMVKAKEDNFAIFDKAVNTIKELGIKDENIIFKHFNCYPNYDYEFGRKVNGYSCSTVFSIKIESLDKVKECASALIDNGVTDIRDISYEVSNIEEEYNNALTLALENSKAKASKILGRDDLKIVSVKEECVYSCNSLYRDYVDSEIATDLIGKLEIEAKVLVEFN